MSELRFANHHIRTISRIIVHPQFRSLGLSKLLIRCLCRNCKTRYVEALAMMGRAHPLFDRAGMRRIEPRSRDSPVYFIFDRQSVRRSRSKRQLKGPAMQSSTRPKSSAKSVLQLARAADRRTNQKNKTKPKSRPQLSHPDNTPEETERLLDELEAHQAAD